jgi:hypothetical protein
MFIIIKEELHLGWKQKFSLPLGNILLEIFKKSKLGEKIMAIAKDLQKRKRYRKQNKKKGNQPTLCCSIFRKGNVARK